MLHLGALQERSKPFRHWVADGFLSDTQLRAINAFWPTSHPAWRVEDGRYGKKASLLFPNELPPPAQHLARELFSAPALEYLSRLTGLELQPDPWFDDGPQEPRLGGGLHEIHPGGLLKVHVDFERHPSGLRRVANLLIYLNESWDPAWGGALELHSTRVDGKVASIPPIGGRAVLFLTTRDSWHGHPHPLRCPPDRTRRSLALYYYSAAAGEGERPKTVYRK